MLLLPFFPTVVALAAALVAAVTDAWRYRIYNALTGPLLISGLIYHGVATDGTGLVPSVLGTCVGFGPMALLYLSGGLGAGDVKLMAGLGAWLGPVMAVHVLFASWFAAGLYAVVVLLCNGMSPCRALARSGLQRGVPRERDQQLSQMIALPTRRRRLIPFGVMILAGILTTVISTANIL